MSPPKRKLLVDGDVIAFIAAAACQHTQIDEDGFASPFATVPETEACVDNHLITLKIGLKADDMEVYLSDPKDNWRRLVDPTYKTNRVGERPLLLDTMKQYLRDKYGATHWAGLEADDTLSILATVPEPEWELVVVGRDKDFLSIPGLHHTIKKDIGPGGKLLVREVSAWEADRFHMMQAMAGDATDGFYGCPGLGMTRAAQIVDKPLRLVPQEGVKTRGINKGEAVTRWVGEPSKDYWSVIVSHYRKAGLGEPEALVTARLARLLRDGEYDRNTGEVTLWTPEKIRHW